MPPFPLIGIGPKESAAALAGPLLPIYQRMPNDSSSWFVSRGLYVIMEGAVHNQPLPKAVPAPARSSLPHCQRPPPPPSLLSIKEKREEPFHSI